MISEHILALGSLAYIALPVLPAIREFYKPKDDTPLFITKGNTADFLTTGVREQIKALSDTAVGQKIVETEKKTNVLLNFDSAAMRTSILLAKTGQVDAIYSNHILIVDNPFPGNLEAKSALVLVAHSGPAVSKEAQPVCLTARCANIVVSEGTQSLITPESVISLLSTPKLAADLSAVYLYETMPIDRTVDLSTVASKPSVAHIVTNELINPLAAVYHHGSIKSKKDIIIPAGSSIKGNIVSEGTIYIGANCYVQGTILAGGDVIIAGGAKIGTVDAWTTVSANKVHLEKGANVSGTIISLEGIYPLAFLYVA